ncbi:hypothetical protein [Ramlibacter alkalitolerans]|uniref:Uncharacterized protein n=1 Tax=Ramlibacter alkalitolerans TaxID=2039631 RepID=A0ABS1JKC0_9BURK|nr:hypothetical protein [Ramlibacter alkalitolerans]MBL0424677.1 hypothetical protein [Ramlibacter alkalitolerans]
MPHDSREARAETLQVLMPWGSPLAEGEDPVAATAFWLAGGASLLLWTAVALLLTSV